MSQEQIREGLRRSYPMSEASPRRPHGDCLISFCSLGSFYILALEHEKGTIWKGGHALAEFPTPWTADQIPKLAWMEVADALYIAHSQHPLHVIQQDGGKWRISVCGESPE